MRAGPVGLLVALVAAASGCDAPCQAVCDEMAEYARECGYTVSQADIDTCVERQSGVTRDERAVCREFGEPGVLRSSWDCLEIGRYYPEQSPVVDEPADAAP